MARHDIKDVKSAAVLEDVISDYVPLHSGGKVLLGCCPFHNDTKPSLKVYPDRQQWACYVCNIFGDVIDFVEKIEECSKQEAIKQIAERYSLSGSKPPTKTLDSQLRREKLKKFRRNIDRRLRLISHYVWDKYNELMRNPELTEDDWEWLSKTETYRTVGFELREEFLQCGNVNLELAFDGKDKPEWLSLAHSPILVNAVTYTKAKATREFAAGLPFHAKLMMRLGQTTKKSEPMDIAVKCFDNNRAIYKAEYDKAIKKAEESMR